MIIEYVVPAATLSDHLPSFPRDGTRGNDGWAGSPRRRARNHPPSGTDPRGFPPAGRSAELDGSPGARPRTPVPAPGTPGAEKS